MQQVGYHLAYNPGWRVQCDSRLVPSTEEVPPEHCSYIRPGDTYDETYRKSTFRHYPNQDVNCIKLAKAGFYFLGFRDRVKCYSCGQVHEDIRHIDDLSLPRCHLDDCEHIQATRQLRPAENPSPNLLLPRNQEEPSLIQGAHSMPVAQSASIHPNPTTFPSNNTTSPRQRVRSPNPYHMDHQHMDRQNLDRQNLDRQHLDRQHLDRQHMDNQHVERNAGITFPNPINSERYPCNFPINPGMRHFRDRLATFNRNWPMHRINAHPEEIAQAGFLYLGESDRVKCWYCNVGLQNWERDDDPWFEHAKWFPHCQYLLANKGPNYVEDIASRFPEIPRSIPFRPPHLITINFNSGGVNSRQQRIINPPAPQRTPPLSMEQRVNQQMTSSTHVARAREMGFTDETIRAALTRHYNLCQEFFPTAQHLINELLSAEDRMSAPSERAQGATGVSETPQEELRRLEERRLCKACHREQASVVLLPCAHVASCIHCSPRITNCPVCLRDVEEKVRSFIV